MKKYANLHAPWVARITAEEQNKTHQKDFAKATKTRLHQLYGAYLHPTACKKAAGVLDGWEKAGAGECADLLRLHASTRERLPHYAAFYEFIFTHVPPPRVVMDLGCGFNPFALEYLLTAMQTTLQKPKDYLHMYHAFDIDTQQAALINRFFAMNNLPAGAECIDLGAENTEIVNTSAGVSNILPNADLTFMLKLLPVLEAQTAGWGYRLAASLQTKYLVLTYPLKSLGGKEKGMARHYRHTFETALNAGELSTFTLLTEGQIGQELIYILQNVLQNVFS